MNKLDYIVHRANSLTSEPDTFAQVERYVQAGFTDIEVDFYVTSAEEYKFCHPIGAEAVKQVFRRGDTTVHEFIKRFSGVRWLIDPKCLDVPQLPKDLILDILSAFDPTRDIVTASQVELLETAHAAGFQTCRYRQNDQKLTYTIDYYSMEDGQQSPLPADRTFVYCPDPAMASRKTGYAGVLVDGEYLL